MGNMDIVSKENLEVRYWHACEVLHHLIDSAQEKLDTQIRCEDVFYEIILAK